MINNSNEWMFNKVKIDILISLNNNKLDNGFFQLNNLSKIIFLIEKLGKENKFVHDYLNFWIARNSAGFEKYIIELQNDILTNLNKKIYKKTYILKQITNFKIEFKQYKVFEIVEFLNDFKKDIMELGS